MKTNLEKMGHFLKFGKKSSITLKTAAINFCLTSLGDWWAYTCLDTVIKSCTIGEKVHKHNTFIEDLGDEILCHVLNFWILDFDTSWRNMPRFMDLNLMDLNLNCWACTQHWKNL